VETSVDLPALWRRPGFLIRRLHQIHVSLFYDEVASSGMTPIQYSLLSALHEHPAIDQVSLAGVVGLDKTSVTEVLARMERAGLIAREANAADRRTRLVSLAPKGREKLRSLAAAVSRAHERTLAPLAPAERELFMQLLMHVVNASNALGRTALRAV
jgi:DNA-binding MarR family transcriptional regulator